MKRCKKCGVQLTIEEQESLDGEHCSDCYSEILEDKYNHNRVI